MRIAVCDDLKSDRQKTIEALKNIIRDFSINEFDDGYELAKSHRVLPFDLIILDIIMPKLGGIETAALIREKDGRVPIVFLSSSDEFGVLSYSVVAFDYLLKPVDGTRLRECIKRLFSMNREKHFVNVTYLGTPTKILLSNIQYLESNLRKVIFTLSENR